MTPEATFEQRVELDRTRIVFSLARGNMPSMLLGAIVLERRPLREAETVADLVVGFNAFKERFTSRVVKDRPSRIRSTRYTVALSGFPGRKK